MALKTFIQKTKVKGKEYRYEKEVLSRTYFNMKSRCTNSNVPEYKHYGGRGIKVCDEWSSYPLFKKWALKSGYKDGLTIERLDNNKDYCPSNCAWIGKTDQSKNRRCVKHIYFNGKSLTLNDWAKELKIKRSTLAQRHYVYKWSVEKLLTT